MTRRVSVAWSDADETVSKRVGIWIRVSTEDQAKGESPALHEKRARLYAEAKGWTVATVYDLSGFSGKSVTGYPQAKTMMADIKRGHISGLIFSKLARLARNTRELLDFAEYFQTYGADLISLAESIDTSTPAGRFFYTLIAALAQWEREEITERIRASVVTRAKMGRSLGGAAPFGYQWMNGKLELELDEAPIRRELFELFATHRRLKTVARLLNEAGHRTRKGAKFSDTTIRRLLEDASAKGKRRINYTKSLGDGKQWVLKPEHEWEWVEVPRIVSDELFDECNAVLKSWKEKNAKRPSRKAVHLFTGLTMCECGGKMHVPSWSKKYVCPACKNRIPLDVLETVFQGKLKAFLSSPEDIAKAFEENDRILSEKRELLEALSREEAKVRHAMDKLFDLFQSDQIGREAFGERHRPLEERLSQLREQIPRSQAEIDLISVHTLSGENLVAEAHELYKDWDKLSGADKRRIVETIVDSITIGSGRIAIELRSQIQPPKLAPPDSINTMCRSSPDHYPLTAAEGQRNVTDSSPPTLRSGPGSKSEPGSARQ